MLIGSPVNLLVLKRGFAIRHAVRGGPTATGRYTKLEKNIPQIRRKKAWEKAGQDKESWFKRKYAHIHARAKNEGVKDPFGKKKAHTDRLAMIEKRSQAQRQDHEGKFEKRSAIQGLKVNPLMEYVYGTNGVLAALQADKREYYTRVLYHGALPTSIAKLAEAKDVKIEESDKHRLNLLTNYAVHNNVVLETKPLQPDEVSHLQLCNPETGTFQYTEMQLENDYVSRELRYLVNEDKKFPLGLYLDEVVDPHNIGAVIRSAYFLGADFIVMSRRNCAPLSPVVSKTSSGAVELIPIFYADKPLTFFNKSQEEGGWAFVTSCLAKSDSRSNKYTRGKTLEMGDLRGMCKELPVMLVIGNEGSGVRTNIKMRSDFFVEIPFGRADVPGVETPVDSLNVSVATALLLNTLLKSP
ncbi:hypothetical protein HG536_0A07110 [Torulaspora globosa]|uniref:rRNA methyltransferase 1, mitochondrial n=1 Tax=Torulaspora globosa TaxID=48254 RepID=A0A7G3ZBL0_9SACH|nr:uncharacterized protein HG536_0A07110 [Torulaspora globosa]QLL30896.1 hypothetical protein HG536_0A07110 [Torulaspora globosa]